MLPGAFADNVTADIDFTDYQVTQCDVAVVKILFYVLVINKWLQINFDVNTNVLFLDLVSCILLIS